jgi:catechol 2,3-dioxygenase-like lactoylglutathione lyase family enzyme
MSQTSIVQPFKLTHGTMLSRNLNNTRKYYEEYLGLEVVRHAKPAMMVRLHSDMYVVCVCIGERVPQQHVLTDWGLNVSTKEEVDQAYEKAQALKEVYGIRKIQSVR